MSSLFFIFILLCPFVIGIEQMGDYFREGKCSWFYGFSALFIGHYFWRKVHPIFGVFVALCGFSTYLSYMHVNQVLDLLCIIFAGFMAIEWKKGSSFDKELVLKGLAAAAVLNSMYGMLQVADLDPFFRAARDPYAPWIVPIGLLGHPTFLGSFVVPASAWLLFNKKYVYFMAANMVLFWCDSTMSWLALAALLTVWFGHRFGRARMVISGIALISLFIICGYLFPSQHLFSSSGRIHVWWEAVRFIEQGPLMGFGLGNYKNMFMYFDVPDGPPFTILHNDYLQLLFELGWMGMAVVLLGLVRAAGNAWKYLAEPRMACFAAIFAALAVNAFGNFTARLIPHSLLALFTWLELVRNNKNP